MNEQEIKSLLNDIQTERKYQIMQDMTFIEKYVPYYLRKALIKKTTTGISIEAKNIKKDEIRLYTFDDDSWSTTALGDELDGHFFKDRQTKFKPGNAPYFSINLKLNIEVAEQLIQAILDKISKTDPNFKTGKHVSQSYSDDKNILFKVTYK